MAWNGSDSAGQPANGKANRPAGRATSMTSPHKAQGVKHGIVALLVIVALGGAALWFFTRPAPHVSAPNTKPKTQKSITEVKPAPAPTNRVSVASGPKIEIRKVGKGKIMKYVDGRAAWMFPREDYHGPVVTTRVAYVKSPVEEAFKHTADQQIASLLMARPGSQLINVLDYRHTFVRDFLASYKDPFVIEASDTDEIKELKKAVAEVKGDLKARYDAGEDIAQIMIDTRKQFRELSAYKREIEEEVNRYRNQKDVSEQDVDDFVAAANKMLADRGIDPIRVRGFLKHRLQQSRAREGANSQNK